VSPRMNSATVLVFVGTRPEAIKLAPVVRALKGLTHLEVVTISTGQHGQMLSDVLEDLDWKPERAYSSLIAGQHLADLYSTLLGKSASLIRELNPQLVLVHGDTATAMASAHAAFLSGVPLAHVEAGLRTGNLLSPFPEEMNRQFIARVASLNFAPTQGAVSNLRSEGVDLDSIKLVGNSIVDATEWVFLKKLFPAEEKAKRLKSLSSVVQGLSIDREFALLTLHRRENSAKFTLILEAVREACEAHPEFQFVFPVHPNPSISKLAKSALSNSANVFLVAPLGYLDFMFLTSKAQFILSDSGGIQEEGVTLSRKILLARDTTERPEALESGFVEMVGTDPDKIKHRLLSLMASSSPEAELNLEQNPFGDGRASLAITRHISEFLRRN
jgi:UDP-N-acetylglucosamine 2-epimerase (non-hydrolysing)